MSYYTRAILPPIEPWDSRPYRPACPQYNNLPAGEIQRSPDGFRTQGNCSPNPPGAPWDFECYHFNGTTRCYASNGRITNSFQQICCPTRTPVPPVQRSCCREPTVNACALCRDRRQGVNDAASHFENMVWCRDNCF